MSEPSTTVLFLGRFHPLLVHLPIGILVVLGILELLSRRPKYKNAAASSGYLLALAVPASIVTVVLGWMLSRAGGYEERLLDWHFWTGIITAVLCTLAAILYRAQAFKAYRICLAVTLVSIMVASHFGGSLTHGSDYLTRYAPAPIRSMLGDAPTDKQEKSPSAYATLIHPILEKNCIGCHGPEKAKAGVRLHTVAAMVQKDEGGGAPVVAGKAAESEIVKHMRLPLDHEEHMPPKGKPQPSPEDIALIEWWIKTGASPDAPVASLKPTQEIQRILAERLGQRSEPPQSSVPKLEREPTLSAASQLSSSLGIVISPLSESGVAFQCNAGLAGTNFGDTQLQKLAGSVIAPGVEVLDLGGSGVTDQGLSALEKFPSLKRLHLERTGVTDKATPHIAKLRSLEYLNLYETKLSDAGLPGLRTMPHLKRVFVWNTFVTAQGAASLAAARANPGEKNRIEQEIAALEAKLKDQQIFVHVSTSNQPAGTKLAGANTASTNAPSTNAVPSTAAVTPVNTTCPVSGKPIDPSKTLVHEGKTYAFCCDECLKKAKTDPKATLAVK